MKVFRFPFLLCLFTFAGTALLVFALPLQAAQKGVALRRPEPSPAVILIDNGGAWSLDNGIVKATISKGDGRMTSLVYHGIDTMRSGGGYWEQTPQDAPQLTNGITIRLVQQP